MGVVPELFASLTRNIEFPNDPSKTPTFLKLDPGEGFRVGGGAYLDSVEAFAVESILARKLDLGRALVEDQVAGRGYAAMAAFAEVSDPLGTGVSEWTQMLTIELVLERGSDSLPTASPSYSRLIWAPIDDIREAITERNPLVVDITLNPFEVCVHGLCLHSMHATLDQPDSPSNYR